jgi:vacuolar-type H+-ATPase subunit E/Vma4
LQVKSSAAQSRTKLRAHFECLRQCVIEALDERLSTLERAVDEAERNALEPLESCEQTLNEQVNVAVRIMEKGCSTLQRRIMSSGYFVII